MKRLFGTDGMRGEAGQFPLDAPTVRTVGASLARHLAERREGRDAAPPRFIVGRDMRESGEWIERAFMEGARGAGAVCESAGIITTPGVAFLARTLPADAGVVISASHNVYRDNGIKIFAPSGRKLDDATERLIETDVLNGRHSTSENLHNQSFTALPDGAFNGKDLRNRYLEFLANEIGHDLSLEGLRLVLDCANGATSDIGPELFRRLGAVVNVINDSPDGRNINLGCGSLHTEALENEVIRQRADLGVAFDGDADRALFVDAKGRLINGDVTLW